MRDRQRPRDELLAELEALRARVTELEKQRATTSSVLHGDPAQRTAPLVQQLPAVVWTTDRQLRLTWWAGGGIEPLGIAPEDVIGVGLEAYFGTADPDFPPIAAHRRALEGVSGSYEVEAGNGVFSIAHVQPFYDAGGAIHGVIGLAIDITQRVRAERDRERLIRELRDTRGRLSVLSGLIPICMHCKNVRNDAGYWEQVETWVHAHSDAEFTHAICPECMQRSLG